METDKQRGFAGQACESCHGPAQKHTESASADDIKQPAKLAAAAADKICLGCHLNQPTHVGRLTSSHAKNQVSCVTCHKIHADGPMGLVPHGTPADQHPMRRLPLECDGAVSEAEPPSVPENAMSCVDCHNPHGSTRTAVLQAFGANEPGCLNCHGDKRGPFAFEHEPVRFESCATCHEPHGSTNPRMLTRQEVAAGVSRMPCQSARVRIRCAWREWFRPAFHDLRSPVYRNCTVCHQAIHGSHIDRNLLK